MQLARFGDLSTHGGALSPPVAFTVLAGGSPVAVLGSLHLCPQPYHPPGPLTPSGSKLLVESLPAGRTGDFLPCGAQVMASLNVLVGG